MDSLWFKPASREPRFGLILLHGLGATSENVAGVVPAVLSGLTEGASSSSGIGAQRIVDDCPFPFLCAVPQAPIQPVGVAGDQSIPAWFNIRTFAIEAEEDEEGLAKACGLIDALVSQFNRQGVDDQHIFLGGFSQGGMLALHILCRAPQRFAGIFGLATCLPRRVEIPQVKDVPVCLAHGADDTVIPPRYGRESYCLLKERGFAIEWHTIPGLGHSINGAMVAQLAAWMRPLL